MDVKKMKSEKFAEEFYFLVMSSPIRERVQALGSRYELSGRGLRDEVLAAAEEMFEDWNAVPDMAAPAR